MKLLDILARELGEWPEGAKYYAQDHCGSAYPYTNEPSRMKGVSRVIWSSNNQLCGGGKVDCKLSADHSTAIITRAEWEKARAQLKGETEMPKANKDGWIRHRGGKQPVGDDVRVDIRKRNGLHQKGRAAAFEWAHEGFAGEVMAYKIINEEQQCSPVVNSGITTESGEAEMPAAKYFGDFPLHSAFVDVESITDLGNPLQWRDRIREIDTTTAALTQERASLVERLASEGFALIEQESAQGEDMSDPANWKVGDMLERLSDAHPSVYRKGVIYPILNFDSNGKPCVQDEFGIDSFCEIEADEIQLFKWHSRPTN